MHHPMRHPMRSLCLTAALGAALLSALLAASLLTGCSKQWENPDIKDSAEAKSRFDTDSRACDVIAGEQYPLSKDKQYKVYSQCMNDRGWVIRDGEFRFSTGTPKK
ncbi:MAG: hypothetical protein KUA35_00630 [Pseudodesulfovibrio sp.]|uniref:Lipoprotein n=1 Tax=Pseudodesulfovibrio aespoeensis (strain ATCC 700646 / DSM 10631 / Aspo-2) TaxID=643562 RepID=E6VQP0_PSEA9|nr:MULTISPECIES: hypothetical protein [Pseudodesulfovibrio]MBU4192085.1 hypothetical protein [Pseudomonadota bacterium]ADU61767.1 hypothetical protein Daes_0750 [Pseudodesulfovibrio aespoeensis Aspo-2]MBU4243040.1 hypothetical protein [Pseudomonadota bacterium]MBU4378269.1 hypothetical protein [Pseudomonadota bacterium]MBU4475827.1 hypothetical protein [Pseudomonadota bacterium]